jgi:hypothetical protein
VIDRNFAEHLRDVDLQGAIRPREVIFVAGAQLGLLRRPDPLLKGYHKEFRDCRRNIAGRLAVVGVVTGRKFRQLCEHGSPIWSVQVAARDARAHEKYGRRDKLPQMLSQLACER